MEGWTPTLVVGVDFGMTCTGVAWSSADWDWGEPKVIQEWPDVRRRLFNKYPSRVGYDDNDRPVDWGECNNARVPIRTAREFKLYLDPSFRDDFEGSPTHAEAVTYYQDYMKEIYRHTEGFLSQRVRDWHQRNVEYRFSIPTTWKNPRLTDQLKDWLAAAGFVYSHNRRVMVSQTEAEAAAVYAAKHYKKGDIIMVVDAGGATTDVNVLEVQERTPQVTRLRALDKAEGVNIGSVLIDIAAKRDISQRLQAMGIQTDTDLLWMAEEMMDDSGFEIFKCNYDGRDMYMDHHMDVPGHPGREVVMKASELRQIFEPLVQDLIKTINSQMSSLQLLHSSHEIRYIVLSGGLGSSKYIERRLRDEYCTGISRPRNANNLEILTAAEPQLAVVKGLVMDRSQALHRGVVVYTGKCCRVSYGAICRLPYNSRLHYGEPTIRDQFTKELWVEDQVDWLIKEGEVVPDEGITRRYQLKVPRGNETESFYAHIVMSELPARQLPHSMLRGPCAKLCVVTGRFGSADFSREQFKYVKKTFSKHKEHHIAEFDLKVIVGTTELGFELVSMDGRRYSQNTAKVQVTWADVPAPSPVPNAQSRIYPAAVR